MIQTCSILADPSHLWLNINCIILWVIHLFDSMSPQGHFAVLIVLIKIREIITIFKCMKVTILSHVLVVVTQVKS